MRLLSDLLGLPLVDSDGRIRGHVHDLTVPLVAPHPRVAGVVIDADHRRTLLLAWSTVTVAAANVRITPATDGPAVTSGAIELEPDEIMLRRDLLDTQIIDLNQHRATRVGDVLLDDLPDSDLEVAAVEVGVRAIVRRLGLHALARRLPAQVVDFADLHLTSSRGHAAQLGAGTAPLHRLDARGLAELLTRLDLESATDVLDAVGPDRAVEAVDAAHPVVRARLLSALNPDQVDSLTATMQGSRADAYRSVASRSDHRLRRRLSRHLGWRLHPPPTSDHDASSSAS